MASRRKKKKSRQQLLNIFVFGVMALLFLLIALITRNKIIHRGNSVESVASKCPPFHPRNSKVISDNAHLIFGIDVSHYNGKIDWSKVDKLYQNYPIHFVVLRATMGKDGKDKNFQTDWQALSDKKIIRGAYHYYRPNENSALQANNFIETVKLQKGDFIPILDVEQMPKIQSMQRLRVGLKNWMDIVEKHYGVKPILYTGKRYYQDYLAKDFSDYPLWIGAYSDAKPQSDWALWQFSDKSCVEGFSANVDLNVFNGTLNDLYKYQLKRTPYN